MAKIGIIRIKKLVDALLAFVKADYENKIAMQIALVHTTANATGVKKKDTVTITGTSGKAAITFDGETRMVVFNTSLNQTTVDFYEDHVAYFLANDIVLTYSTNKLIFEAHTAGVAFISPTVSDRKSESFLMRCFDTDDVIEGVIYSDLAIEIFTRPVTDQRRLETRLLFDPDRSSIPTIHVREPSKSKGKQDAIGYIGQGFYGNFDGSQEEERRRSFDSQYELMITSMNRHEVVIIEEVLLALIVGSQDSFAIQEPFYQISFSVKELIANNDLVPNPLFIKSIMINLSYDKTYPNISNEEVLNSILFEQLILPA